MLVSLRQLTSRAFNLLNRTNYQDPNGTWGSSSFGVISDAYDPRVMQAAVRLLSPRRHRLHHGRPTQTIWSAFQEKNREVL